MAQGIKRTTISLPADLKDLMDQLQGVNWSAVAAVAFRSKIEELGFRSLVEHLAPQEKMWSREQIKEIVSDMLHCSGTH